MHFKAMEIRVTSGSGFVLCRNLLNNQGTTANRFPWKFASYFRVQCWQTYFYEDFSNMRKTPLKNFCIDL